MHGVHLCECLCAGGLHGCTLTLGTGFLAPSWLSTTSLSLAGGKQGSLVNTLREVEPTSHMGVPRVWEKIMERIQEVAAQSGFIRRKMLLWAMSVTLEQNLTCPSRYRGPGKKRPGEAAGLARNPGTQRRI